MGLLRRILGRGSATPASHATVDESEPLLVNAYATVGEMPLLDFPHQPIGQRDLSNAAMASHLQGFIGYVLGSGDGQMTAARYHLWRHIQRVRNQASFNVAPEDLAAMGGWARRANAILFLPDGSVRAPDLATLMTADGQFDASAALPYPPDAVERKARTMALLKDMTPNPPAGMPPSLGAEEIMLRSSREVVQRALALTCVAAQAEAIQAGEGSMLELLRERNPVGVAALTAQETAFMQAARPDDQSLVQMSWRYEAANVLAWALALDGADLGWADKPADAATLSQIMLHLAQSDALQTQARLRPTDDILDALDLAWRQHWIVRQARQAGIAVQGLHPSVVLERHVALNWLTGFQNEPDTNWDDTDTPS